MKEYTNSVTSLKILIPPTLLLSIAVVVYAIISVKDVLNLISIIFAVICISGGLIFVYFYLNELMYTIYYDEEMILLKKFRKEKSIRFSEIKCVVVSGNNLFLLKEKPNFELKKGVNALYKQLKNEPILVLGPSNDILRILSYYNFDIIYKKPNLNLKRIKKWLEK